MSYGLRRVRDRTCHGATVNTEHSWALAVESAGKCVGTCSELSYKLVRLASVFVLTL